MAANVEVGAGVGAVAGAAANPAVDGENLPYPNVPANEVLAAVACGEIAEVTGMKSYSIRNGDPVDVEPYLLTASIPAAYHWMPINNLPPSRALECMEGFIKSHIYRLTVNPVETMNNDAKRRYGIMLGALRCVMTANYDILSNDLNSQETAAPVLAATFTAAAEGEARGTVSFNVLVPSSAPNVNILTGALALNPNERELIKIYMRCAQAIPPLQGLNVINDGHHYLSDKSKASYRSFFAVEKQVWIPTCIRDIRDAEPDVLRDVMWHKAGHPISVPLKEALATDPRVKTMLDNAKLGSAATRLPAMETDVKAADTYIKVCDAVNAIWVTMEGGIDVEDLRLRTNAVKTMSRGANNEMTDLGGGLRTASRAEAVAGLKTMLAANESVVGMAYGFYSALMEQTASDTGDTTRDTLRGAHSLNRLQRNNPSSYALGSELYRDYRFARNQQRQTGRIKMPGVRVEFVAEAGDGR